jgi:hypothetical protein
MTQPARDEMDRDERDAKYPFNVFKERDEIQQSLDNSIAEERRLRILHQQEFSRAEIAEATVARLTADNAELRRERDGLRRVADAARAFQSAKNAMCSAACRPSGTMKELNAEFSRSMRELDTALAAITPTAPAEAEKGTQA